MRQPLKGRRLRVLVVVDRLFEVGGAERLASALALRIDKERFEPIVCATRGFVNPALMVELEAAGVRVLTLNRRSKVSLFAWQPLLSLIRRERIDVIHAHQFGSNVWGALIGTITGVPVVVAHEHGWSFEGKLQRFLDRELIARQADVFLAVCGEDRRRMVEVERIDPARVRVLPNGIPPLPEPALDLRAELGIPVETPVVGTIAVLRPEKAIDMLVSAASLLLPEFPSLRLLIAGDGQERPRLEALCRTAGLEGSVSFLGLRSDIPEFLAALDVAVCCSDREGSPLSVMEYMAAGKPVVATRVGGIPELVREGREGLLVKRRDTRALAAALGELLRDPARRTAMGASGQARQRREFDLDTMVERVANLYEELYAKTKRARRERWSPRQVVPSVQAGSGARAGMPSP